MPYLQLKLLSEPLTGQNNNCRFTEQGGSIGRADECTWTLVDNDRFISKKHLVVVFQNQQFMLTDLSSNGVFVNNSKTPLGKDNQHVLQLSDKLTLGKHIISVEQIELSAKIPTPPPPYSEIDNSDLFGLVMGKAEEKSKPVIDSPADKPDIIKKQVDQSASNLGLNEILSEPVKHTIGNKPAASQTGQAVETEKPPNSIIPDDWELSEIMPVAKDYQPSNDSLSSENNPVQPVSAFGNKPFDSARLNPEPQKSERPVKAEDMSSNDEYQMTPSEQVIDQAPISGPTNALPESAQPAVSENVLPQASEPSNKLVSKDTFFKVFYEKLGLPKEYMDNVDAEVFATDIVDVLLSSTSGLMSLLSSRLLFKHEARLSATLIQAKSNNPIKFSIDPVDTLEMLLLKKKKGYMSAKDSYDEAINDIQLHQTAILSGLQASLVGILNELSPEKIEKKIAEKTPRFMGLNSNSQCWQLYKEQQSALLNSVNENLNDILSTYFSEAYQAQINNLKNK